MIMLPDMSSAAKMRRKDAIATHAVSPLGLLLFITIEITAVILAAILDSYKVPDAIILAVVLPLTLLAMYIMAAWKMANQWEKAVILRMGKFHGLRGPGLFWMIPVVDSIAAWIDHRVMVTPFNAEKTLTKDTVPVDVDAVLFWMVWDAQKASL
jgi:hypothetical protein